MRLLAIDFGEKRIGVAISDEERIIAYPLCIIKRTSDHNAISKIEKLCIENKVGKILLGYPLNLKGKDSPITRRVKSFFKKLKKVEPEVILYDERWTTKIAASQFDDHMVDARAAAIMLGEYLEKIRCSG